MEKIITPRLVHLLIHKNMKLSTPDFRHKILNITLLICTLIYARE